MTGRIRIGGIEAHGIPIVPAESIWMFVPMIPTRMWLQTAVQVAPM
jgi:hypothetical protein